MSDIPEDNKQAVEEEIRADEAQLKLDQHLEALNKKRDEIIAKYGFMVEGNGGVKEPEWGVTIGRTAQGKPEVFTRIFDANIFQLLTEGLGRLEATDKTKIEVGVVFLSKTLSIPVSGLSIKLRAMFKQVPLEEVESFFGESIRRYGREAVAAAGVYELTFGNADNKLPHELKH